MPHTKWDDVRAEVRSRLRAQYVEACVSMLEDAHSIFYMRHEAHDAEARQRTAERFVDTLIVPVLERVKAVQ